MVSVRTLQCPPYSVEHATESNTITRMTLAPSSSLRRSLVEIAEVADNDLFESPPDLLCPITHELFYDPVINAAGQVYERAAIEKALAHKLVDPISNLPLDTAALTTVWPMKSKAAAYRERAVRGCIAQVCKPSCRTPIRYLRRAAELSAGAAACGGGPGGSVLGLPGLTREVVEYLLTHPSSIYDFQALSRFAASLAAGGHRDLAAGLYTKLLQQDGDSAQQVEALRGLLACWGGPEEEEDEQQLVERLAGLSCGEGAEGCCRPARFVGVLLAAGLSEELVVRFCEYILGSSSAAGPAGPPQQQQLQQQLASSCSGRLSNRASSAEPCGSGGMSGAAAVAASGGAGGNADLLYVYTKLRCG
ncbi:hypothetical protein Agub_g9812, partial [Astrephomene gubernaculifera]